MIDITLIAPYEELISLFEETFHQHNLISQRYEYENDEYRLQSILAYHVSEVSEYKLDGEVIVARGYMAQGLRDKNVYLPVVEIPVAANDLIYSLYQAKTVKNARKIGVVGAANMLRGLTGLGEMLGVETIPYVVHDHSVLPRSVQRAVDDQCDAIVSGVTGCRYADELGIPSVFLFSQKETIWYSITEAKRLAYISRQEREKSQYMESLLDHSQQGIMAIDNGLIVRHINNKARDLLAIPQEMLNHGIDRAAFPGSDQIRELVRAGEESDSLLNLRDERTVNCTKRVIKIKEEEIGFLLAIQDVGEIQELESKIRSKIHSRGHTAHHTFDDIIGVSEELMSVKERAEHFSHTDSGILLLGDSGTGKELFAQSIHNAGKRRSGPFIAFNCASLSESLLESELFGYSPGSFTGALKEGKKGLFELAHGGTVFLDEISKVSDRLQTMLLRVLQEREVMRLGDGKIIPVDIRVIAASNKDLSVMVNEGEFREDLYYRLNVLRLSIPPLDRRRADIPIIADFWIKKLSESLHLQKPQLSQEVKDALGQLSWPGNIRQLRNVCERIVVLFAGKELKPADLHTLVDPQEGAAPEIGPQEIPADEAEAEDEGARIREALQGARYNRQKAADMLGMSRTTLWRKMREFDL